MATVTGGKASSLGSQGACLSHASHCRLLDLSVHRHHTDKPTMRLVSAHANGDDGGGALHTGRGAVQVARECCRD